MITSRAWKSLGGRGFGPAPFLVAGIVNLTPDSFSDGGRYLLPKDAAARCQEVVDEGAAILDLGGESTRPGARAVDAATEIARLRPGLIAACSIRDTTPEKNLHIAVDTRRAATAAAVLEDGVDIINDISGASFDPAMAEVLASYKPGYVLTHSPATPDRMQEHTEYSGYGCVTDAVLAFWEEQMARLIAAGLPEDRIILDPGIGFGKKPAQNWELLQQLSRLHSLGRPLYIGVSRKRFLADFLGIEAAEGDFGRRDAATGVLTALAAQRGAYVHRVHAVAGTVAAIKLTTLLS